MNIEQSKLIESLFLEMHDLLKSYALSILRDESLAEEAVQETFQVACNRPEALFESPNPKGWLVNTLKFTLHNMILSRESSQRLLSKYLSMQTDTMAFSEDKVSFEVMYQNIADTEEFKLIKEMAIDGKSHLEMAKARGITVAACKKRVQRAKEILKKKLKIDVTL